MPTLGVLPYSFQFLRVASLNRRKKQGTNSKALEKVKAIVSHLHKRGLDELEQDGIEDKP